MCRRSLFRYNMEYSNNVSISKSHLLHALDVHVFNETIVRLLSLVYKSACLKRCLFAVDHWKNVIER